MTTERNALKEKVDDLNNVVVEKSQTIDNLKQELSEAHEKDLKIYDLEMDIDVLQGVDMYLRNCVCPSVLDMPVHVVVLQVAKKILVSRKV